MNAQIPSPCINNCCLDDDDICLGCYRHIDEIVQWGAADDEERTLILAKASERKNQASHVFRKPRD